MKKKLGLLMIRGSGDTGFKRQEHFMQKLEKELAKAKQMKCMEKKQWLYCRTHSYLVAKGHNSKTCHSKKASHQDETTQENNMGGLHERKTGKWRD